MGQLRMVDVGGKAATARRALARGTLTMGRRAFALLAAGRLPKGDALRLGELAGILGAKSASATIPLCHPLPLDKVSVRFELDAPRLHAFCEAAALAKTGVEMEALAGVSAALLAVWDVVKQVDPALTISDVRLEVKEGGKSGLWLHPNSRAAGSRVSSPKARRRGAPSLGRASVITVSDRRSRGQAADTCGPLLAAGLRELGFRVSRPALVPDEPGPIARAVRRAARGSALVALTGGTGLSPRDVTPETVAALCDRLIPGVGEALRAAGSGATPHAALSRSLAGQLGRTVVVCLPGSRGGVADGLAVLAGLLPHAVRVASGEDPHPAPLPPRGRGRPRS